MEGAPEQITPERENKAVLTIELPEFESIVASESEMEALVESTSDTIVEAIFTGPVLTFLEGISELSKDPANKDLVASVMENFNTSGVTFLANNELVISSIMKTFKEKITDPVTRITDEKWNAVRENDFQNAETTQEVTELYEQFKTWFDSIHKKSGDYLDAYTSKISTLIDQKVKKFIQEKIQLTS